MSINIWSTLILNKKKLLFISGTRADYGKLKSLINITMKSENYDVRIFVTGMHLDHKYGYTVNEFKKAGYTNIHTYNNDGPGFTMDLRLASTIKGISEYAKIESPDLIIVHGDRVEALAGAIVGSLSNILVAHIEGGEVSGTVDEIIRHAVSKMSHLHFVANAQAERRLHQMGEDSKNTYIIGSPDVDIMFSNKLPSLSIAKTYYEIPFEDYGVVLFHPVTTELDSFMESTNSLVEALEADEGSYIIVYPNNDSGSDIILKAYEKLENNPRFRIFPSIRFEYFLTFMKYSSFVIGNSSAGIREAPYYNIPSVNIGSRQKNRALSPSIIHVDYSQKEISGAIQAAKSQMKESADSHFGKGDSDLRFLEILDSLNFWQTPNQKYFIDVI
jgi:UDP-N-acetylglucosamine 2-epimerase (hydrolysing)